MELIDTHSHLYAPEFDDDREAVLQRARAAGVMTLLLPAIDSESHARMLALSSLHPDSCRPMMGLHPTSINDNPLWREELLQVEEYLKNPPVDRFVGIGEIGLDFYWSDQFRAEQTIAFRRQIELSLTYNLPIVIHTRSAWPEMLAIIESYAGSGVRGVFHAFSEPEETYQRLKNSGDFLFGIGGMVTFKKSALAATVRTMNLRDLVLETDCPYLTPAPFRGTRNESGYIPYICDQIANLTGYTSSEVARLTTANAHRMFDLNRSL
ncbi:MAG: TatD family hydrolase [Alistipes sp.]